MAPLWLGLASEVLTLTYREVSEHCPHMVSWLGLGLGLGLGGGLGACPQLVRVRVEDIVMGGLGGLPPKLAG